MGEDHTSEISSLSSEISYLRRKLQNLRQELSEQKKKAESQENAYGEIQKDKQKIDNFGQRISSFRDKRDLFNHTNVIKKAMQLIIDESTGIQSEQESDMGDLLADCQKEYDDTIQKIKDIQSEISRVERQLAQARSALSSLQEE